MRHAGCFRDLQGSDLGELRGWFEDAELSRRLSFPTGEWFSYVTEREIARCWVALDGSEIIAMIQVDCESPERGYLDLAVRPSLRGQGIGTRVLKAFLSGPGRVYPVLEGRIEPDNPASIACCRRCGFDILPTPDSDGFLSAVYHGQTAEQGWS